MKRINPASLPFPRSRQASHGSSAYAAWLPRLLAGAACGMLLAGPAWAQAVGTGTGTAPASTTNNGPAIAIASAPQAAAAAAGSSLPSSSGSVFSMLLGLVAVLAVMAAIAWALKRFGLTRPLAGNAAARIIGGVSVGTRERVMVIEVGEQWIVVGVAPGRVNALTTMPRQEHNGATAAPAAGPAFATWLRQTMDKRTSDAGSGKQAGNNGNTGNTGNDGSTS